MMTTDNNSTPLLVRDLMTVGVPTCPPEFPLGELIATMMTRSWEAIVVLDEHGHAVGWVGKSQLLQAYARGGYEAFTAEDVMEPALPSVPPDIPLAAAAQIMLDRGEGVLYITHHAGGIEYPAAWLTLSHFLRHMAGGDLGDLGIEAKREKPLDVFIRRRDEARRRAGLNEEK